MQQVAGSSIWHCDINSLYVFSQAASADYFYYTSNGFSRNIYDIGADMTARRVWRLRRDKIVLKQDNRVRSNLHNRARRLLTRRRRVFSDMLENAG